jgi:ubiquinone/menaquinone biosynthesis C-methylase UbiE
MSKSVCPWWIGYLLACPLRRLAQDPAKILAPYVRPGTTVLEVGPGMGFFTLPLARMTGPAGRIVAVDIQPKMLDALRRRALKAGLSGRIDSRLAHPESLGLGDLAKRVDFVLAFAVVHEMPSAAAFFAEAASALRPGGSLLLAEPAGHVQPAQFQAQLRAAEEAGLQSSSGPPIWRSHTALLTKS